MLIKATTVLLCAVYSVLPYVWWITSTNLIQSYKTFCTIINLRHIHPLTHTSPALHNANISPPSSHQSSHHPPSCWRNRHLPLWYTTRKTAHISPVNKVNCSLCDQSVFSTWSLKIYILCHLFNSSNELLKIAVIVLWYSRITKVYLFNVHCCDMSLLVHWKELIDRAVQARMILCKSLNKPRAIPVRMM